jgi:hypothetical protein
VIVCKHERRRAALQGGFDHRSRIDGCPIDGALLESLDTVPQKPVARIEIRNLEDLVLERPYSHAPEL